MCTEKKILLNQKHLFPKACVLSIHKNILQEPRNMLYRGYIAVYMGLYIIQGLEFSTFYRAR